NDYFQANSLIVTACVFHICLPSLRLVQSYI
ncbi:hypothetical protein X975_03422, partial [Stegodyphus mimosarum]